MKRLFSLCLMISLTVGMALAQNWRLDAEDDAATFTDNNGLLTIETSMGATLWYTERLDGNIVIEYEARIVPDCRFKDKKGNVRVSDLNCFWMADATTPPGGSGKFVNNYALNLYYVGYGGNGNTTTRFRRYDGDSRGVEQPAYRPVIIKEYLDTAHLLIPNHWYKIRLEQIDGRVRYIIDGECIVDYIDDSPLTSGYFGFRTTLANAQLRNFKYTNVGKGKTYYVAPNGDDSNVGSIERPFATLARAQSSVEAGDTVYIRGGTYRLSNGDVMGLYEGFYHCAFIMDKSGLPGQRICYFGYPGERPVFDLSDVMFDRGRISAFSVTGSYLHFKNFDVVGTRVIFSTRNTQSECFSNRGGSHNIYEELAMHDGEAIGFYLTKGSDNLVLNCDAYRNWEITPTSSGGGRGGNIDGFGAHPSGGSIGNAFRGCRAWMNADDGFDLINSSEVVCIDDCWAIANGYRPDSDNPQRMISLADGNGIKAGGYGMKEHPKCPAVIPMHRVTNCIACGNKASGIYANHHLGGVYFANNTSCNNRFNYNMVCRKSAAEAIDVDGYGHVLINNLSHMPRELDVRALDYAQSHVVGCSFAQDQTSLDDDAFVSLDFTQLMAQRKSDGSLPDIDFMRAVISSDIGNMGYIFDGSRTPMCNDGK